MNWIGAGLVMTAPGFRSAGSLAPLLLRASDVIAILLVGLTYAEAGIGDAPGRW